MVLKNADTEFSPRISPRNWLLPVLNNQNTPPAAPNDGDRYRVTAVATGLWTGQENTIAVWEADASKWRFASLVEPQIWYDMTSQNWHYMSHAGVITQFDKIPLAISDVTGLQAALDGKAPLVHKANHVSGGSDAFVGGDLLDATARLDFLLAGAGVSARRGLNLIAGANISLTFVDNPGSERADLTINAAVGGNHNLLDGNVDQDTTNSAAARGSIIVGNATPKWTVLALGAAATYLRSNGTDLVFAGLQSADIIAGLGYTPTNPANYDTANNPSTLDGSAKVKASELNNAGQATVTIAGVTDTLEHFVMLGA
ncbi:MAG: DUF2793 domain-containing protein [Nitrosotalea sp.]